MHVLIAPNAFKHGPGATEVARAIELGIKKSGLQCTTTLFPVGDGGDGTAGLIIEKEKGIRVPVHTVDPFGKEMLTEFGLIDNGATAVIEMANASGTRLLEKHQLNPLRASTYGTGLIIKHALDKGVSRIIIGMGGSATVDGGTGILQALGFRFLNREGEELQSLPGSLIDLYSIDDRNIDTRIAACTIIVLCDVRNVLLGKEGAAEVFGPQKGADAEMVQKLETALMQWSRRTLAHTGIDMAALVHGGTAGGAAAGMHAYLNAQLVDGAAYFLQATGFNEALSQADVVITGEGSLDAQTIQGKAPFAVAQAAKEKGIPVIGMGGKIPTEDVKDLNSYFDVLMSISPGPSSLTESIKDTEINLEQTAKAIGNLLSIGNKNKIFKSS
jgi:glycerate kinase